jgi:hypothetical protein
MTCCIKKLVICAVLFTAFLILFAHKLTYKTQMPAYGVVSHARCFSIASALDLSRADSSTAK